MSYRDQWEAQAGAFVGETANGSRGAYGPHHDLLRTLVAARAPTRVLLVGVGVGRELVLLTAMQIPVIIGYDVSAAMIAAAQAAVPDCTYLRGDISDNSTPLPLVDCAITFACLSHLHPDDARRALARLVACAPACLLVECAGEGFLGAWYDIQTYGHPYATWAREDGYRVTVHAESIAGEGGASPYAVLEIAE